MDSELLTKIYYNPSTGLSSAKQLHINAKKEGYKGTMKNVKDWLSNQEIQQIHTTQEKHYLPIIPHTPNDFQMDILVIKQYFRQNKGYENIMNFINTASRKAYSYPMKSKSQVEVNRVFKLFMADVDDKVKNITSDSEASFANIIKKYPHIKHWKVEPNEGKGRVSMVERFNGTLRGKISKYMKLHSTKTWVDVLPQLVENYNNSVHSTINKAPNDFNPEKDTPKLVAKLESKGLETMKEFNSFHIGDNVRVLKPKEMFDKGKEVFSRQIYIIDEIDKLAFKLKNHKGVVLKARFKNWQLQKVSGEPQVMTPDVTPEVEQHSTKEIKSLNKFVRNQTKEFDKNVVDKDTGNVYIHPRLQPRNTKRVTKRINYKN